jgi:antitoxin component of RelBE/YafQ-DinJ toxin-antitoxin module
MSKIIVKPKNKEEQNFLTRLLKKMDVKAEVVDESSPNEETQKAIEDVENKKGTKVRDSQDLFNKLGSGTHSDLF